MVVYKLILVSHATLASDDHADATTNLHLAVFYFAPMFHFAPTFPITTKIWYQVLAYPRPSPFLAWHECKKIVPLPRGSSWWRHQMKHFPRYWPFVQGIHRSPVSSPHKGQWRGALMFSLICAGMNGWVNNLEAGHLRRHRGHYDATVM